MRRSNLDRLVQGSHAGHQRTVGGLELQRPVERVRRREGSRTLDKVEEPLARLSCGVLTVQVERTGERRVVPVGDGRLLLPKLRLRPDFGAHRALGVVERVAVGDPP
jgi:hypothetical protein